MSEPRMAQEDALTGFIQKREGMNWSDSQDFAYEILEFLERWEKADE